MAGIIKVVLGLFLCFCVVLNAEETKVAQLSMEKIDRKIQQTHLQLGQLTHYHSIVMKKFEHFGQNLRSVYRAGEGLIESEVMAILDTVSYVAEKHQLQKRKSGLQAPYVSHLISVADFLLDLGKVRDAEILIAGLLHDVVEDTETSFEEIEQRFGIRVEGFVRELTDDKVLTAQERKQKQIDLAPGRSAGAAMISLADKLHNLIEIGANPPQTWSKERVDQYFLWAEKVVNNLPLVNGALKEAVDQVIQNEKTKNKITGAG